MNRRGRSPTKKSRSTNAVLVEDMIDTEDQEELIQSLKKEAQQQSELFQKVFAVVSVFAMVVSLFVYPFLCYDECSQRLVSCWTHALVSCMMHGLSIYCSRRKNTSIPSNSTSTSDTTTDPIVLCESVWKIKQFQIAAVLNVSPLLLWVVGVFDQDVEHFHLGLVLGNVVTLVGAFLMVWDTQSTQQALNELNGAKYEHKTL